MTTAPEMVAFNPVGAVIEATGEPPDEPRMNGPMKLEYVVVAVG